MRREWPWRVPSPWVLLALVTVIVSALLTPSALPDWYRCPTLALSGLPCPGCGMTRAFIAIAHGDLAGAWSLNALSFPLFSAIILAAFAPVRRQFTRLGPRGAVTLLTLAWVWNFARIAA